MARVIYTEAPQKLGGATTTTQLFKRVTPAPVQKENQQQESIQQTKNVSQLEIQPRILRQKQSQEMVQIMLHVSFGTLFYLREFLPLPCFEERDLLKLSHRDTHISYDDFIQNNASGSGETRARTSPASGRKGQPLKILVRNRDENADAILDLLEHGIFEAIEKNVLEAVQLTVFVDKDVPSNVLESYTFSFKYTGGSSDVNNRLASVSLVQTGCTADMKTTRGAKLGLEMIVRRLITLSTFLPILPNKRFLGVHLFYSEDCPLEYEPPGFARSTDDTLVFPHEEDWARESQSCGTMESGFHSVGLKVSSLKWTGTDQNDAGSIRQIPDDIQYSTSISREEDIAIESDDMCHAVQSEPSSSQQSTQTRQDTVAKKTLQKMIPDDPSTAGNSLDPTQVIKDSLGSVVPGNTVMGLPRPHLSQSKLSALEKQHARSTPEYFRKPDRDVNEDGVVHCQCDWQMEDGDMEQCMFCQTWQHLLCYGFVGPNDPNIPEAHVCYKCLLEPNEAPLLREMGTLVLLRRALRIILEEGYPNRVRDFSQKLHCNGQTVVQVTDLLKKQGLLQATPGSKRRGFTETGLPKFRVPESSEVREQLQQGIFDPFAKISHHYTFSGPSQLIPESSLPSIPSQLSAARTDQCGNPASAENDQLHFLREVQDTQGSSSSRGPQIGGRCSVADSGEGHQGSGSGTWAAGYRDARKRMPHVSDVEMMKPVEGLSWSGGGRGQAGPHGATDGMDTTPTSTTTCGERTGEGNGEREGTPPAKRRRKMSNIVQPVEVGEPSDEDSS